MHIKISWSTLQLIRTAYNISLKLFELNAYINKYFRIDSRQQQELTDIRFYFENYFKDIDMGCDCAQSNLAEFI